MNSDVFDSLYKKLNSAQKQAVDTVEGPVMVIAGPGTGKTQILTLRIANILRQTDIGPENILALTFTESGAYAMRRRLVDIIGSAAYKITISTFHGFCNDIIKKYPEEFPRIIGSNSMTDIDQIRILEDVIREIPLEKLKPYGDNFYYLRPASSHIKNLKRDNIDPQEFEKLVKSEEKRFSKIDDLYYEKGAYKGKMKGVYKDLEKNIEKNKDLSEIYKKYEELLVKERLYDYEDMIMEVIRALERNSDLLLRLQEQYQYILADEHQDANLAQNKILELLSSFHKNPNLFIVGDEKQAIFRFQGASLENFLYFQKLYPECVRINLEYNYRSTQPILEAAHSLISKNKINENLRIPLKAQVIYPEVKVKLCVFNEAEKEYLYLIHDIKNKIKSGVKPHEIAVLYRENRDVFPIAQTLEKTEIPFVIESGQDVLSDDEISKLITVFRAVNGVGSDDLLWQLLFVDFFGIDSLDIHKIVSYARKEKILLFDALKEQQLKQAGVSDWATCLSVYKRLLMWSRLGKNKNIVEVFEIIARESGFLNHILALKGSLDKLNKLNTLFNEVKKIAENNKQYKLADFIRYLDLLASHKILITINSVGKESQGVRLMTAHRSKGLEFEYVYILNVKDGHWGNKREIHHFHLPSQKENTVLFEPIDDERRLFYVALTRAKKEVTIIYAKRGLHNEEQLPSQFISEIKEGCIDLVDVTPYEKIFDELRAFVYAPRLNFGIDLKHKEFLKQLFLEQGLSVTALNKYLLCPWDYFFENLIRLPRPQTKHQMYGTAVHETLKIFFDKYRNEEDLSKDVFIELFENSLRKKPFEESDFRESLIKGKKALQGYYDTYYPRWTRSLITEYGVGGIHLPVEVSGEKYEILLKGVLDKLEITDNGVVNVVDYKTKQPMSRNEIEGKTKNATGDYKRQLIFYKLLLDRYESGSKGKYRMSSGEIDFIEPDQKGTFKTEKFIITDDDVEELIKTIERVAGEILTFSFWDKKCEDEKCAYCKLREAIKSEALE